MDVAELVAAMTKARTALGWSCAEVGRRLGIDRTSPSRWERGDWAPGEEYQKRLADWLNSDEVRSVLDGATQKRHALDQEETEAINRCLRIAGHFNILIEDLMPFFLNGNRRAREIFRENLVNTDYTYLHTMLEALMSSDEGVFQRWKAFTTHDYGSFGLRRESQDGKTKHRASQGEHAQVSRNRVQKSPRSLERVRV